MELKKRIKKIEKQFNADCITYNGSINFDSPNIIEEALLPLITKNKHKKLVFILTTPGGFIQSVERIVHVVRQFYEEVYFVIPDYAYSAGTVLCMSGDEIWMNYLSVLGPIDAQIPINDEKRVSVRSYLDKIDELIEKSKKEKDDEDYITLPELQMLINFDLGEWGELVRTENYAIERLQDFLIKYKFKNWKITEKNKNDVTDEYKKERARKIATKLSSNEWNHHGKPLNVEILTQELELKINDYSKNLKLSKIMSDYYSLFEELARDNVNIYKDILIHTRRIKL